MKKIFVSVSLLSFFAVLLLPVFAGAQVVPPPPPGQGAAGPGSPSELIELLNTILTWVSTIFWIVAVIFILYAGFLYLTAAGDPEKVKKASTQLLYSVIAVAVALVSTVIPTFVANFLERR